MARITTISAAVVCGLALLAVVGLSLLQPLQRRSTIPPPPRLERPVAEATRFQPPVDTNPDGVVREVVASLSTHHQLSVWLAGDGLVRSLVAAVDDVASGASPAHHLGFLAPGRRFSVIERADRTTANPVSYGRYDLPTEVFVSVDTEGAIAAYEGLRSELEAAHREVTPWNTGFHERLLEAVDHLLETPIPEDDPALVPIISAWAYVDPELEALSDAQRHLLRMGPRNARMVHGKRAALSGPKEVRLVDADVAAEPAKLGEDRSAAADAHATDVVMARNAEDSPRVADKAEMIP